MIFKCIILPEAIEVNVVNIFEQTTDSLQDIIIFPPLVRDMKEH